MTTTKYYSNTMVSTNGNGNTLSYEFVNGRVQYALIDRGYNILRKGL